MKYSIHRLLALKKTTWARIQDILRNAKFISAYKGVQDNVNGVPVTKIEEEIKANYQKLENLISNYQKIKIALLNSNAGAPDPATLKKVEVCGEKYTMSELIFLSDEIYGNQNHTVAAYPMMIKTMSYQYTDMLTRIESEYQKVENKITAYLNQVGGEKAQSTKDLEERSAMFHRDGDLHMIDPLNLKEKIDNLQNKLDKFIVEADASISESNALTVVELDLTD